ncbi:hypothetical protein N568_0109110 [Lactococcus garvieae TRF1]|uniref:DUF218 domain-containing protein n=1 Tax=Lactococcus garvieae TRF1 TaxID=1380772 RepID=V8AN13_9LACT|nr:hypothetical protein N568_0109110 [Lactococcus garvieae TRF1]
MLILLYTLTLSITCTIIVNKTFLKQKPFSPALNKYIKIIIYFLIMFFAWLISLELTITSFYFLIPLFSLLMFLFSYSHEKRKSLNGLLFNNFLLILILYFIYLYWETNQPLIYILLLTIIMSLSVIFTFGVYLLILFLIWNAKIVAKRENLSLANSLTLLLAVSLIIAGGLYSFFYLSLPIWGAVLLSFCIVILFYYSLVVYNFFTVSFIYQFNRPDYNQDYIIVLGSGLIQGKRVSKLLANRIDKAIEFYHFQIKVNNKKPQIIMSGGKGEDEDISEALAMKNYAIEKNIPHSDIWIEDQSRNTMENMLFSKNIIEKNSNQQSYKALYTTNNYHLFRAGLIAKEANLKAYGIGASTAIYFLPNALLREAIAIILMHKMRHLIVTCILAIIGVLASLLTFIIFN